MPRYPIPPPPSAMGGSVAPYRQGDTIADLIFAGGNARARGAEESGQIWGNTLANIGQMFGGVIQQKAQQKQLAKRDAVWLNFVQSGEWRKDPEAAYGMAMRVWGPEEGPKQFQGLQSVARLSTAKEPNPDQDRKDMGVLIRSAQSMTPQARAAIYPQLAALGKRVFPQAQIPDAYDDDFWNSTIAPMAGPLMGEKAEKPQTATVKGPNGEPVLKSLTSEELAAGVPTYVAPKTPTAGSFEDFSTADDTKRAKILADRKLYGQADDRARISIDTGQANDVRDAVAAMKEGTVPPQLPGRASKEYVAIMAEAKRQGYNLAEAATDWNATQKHIATLNGAQQLRMTQAIDNAAESLDVIDGLAKQWKASGFPLLNKGKLIAAKSGALGPEAQKIATKLEAQISDVTSELGNVYMGGNSPTDHALGLASKNLSADWSESTLRAMTDLARTNLRIRRNSMRTAGVAGASPNNPYAPRTDTPTGAPRVGERKTFPNGRTAVWDGQGWAAQ